MAEAKSEPTQKTMGRGIATTLKGLLFVGMWMGLAGVYWE